MKGKCEIIKYTNHAIEFMAARGISEEEVEAGISNGKVFEPYPDDKPFPSELLLAFVHNKPIHIVLAWEKKSKTCFVVTAYEPSFEKFEPDFITRKKKT